MAPAVSRRVTHRAVDEIAGLPQGPSTSLFPEKGHASHRRAQHLAQILEKDCDELQVEFAETAAKQGLDAAVAYVAKELVAYADNSRQLFLARMELTMASPAARILQASVQSCPLQHAGRSSSFSSSSRMDAPMSLSRPALA